MADGTVLIDLTSDTVTADHMLSGRTAHSSSGAQVTGTITSKAAATYQPGTTDQTIAAGQYLSGAQTISGDANLLATNIKKDVSIFGVTGTYEGTLVVVEDTLDTNGGTIRNITTSTDPIYAEVLNVTINGTYTPSTARSYRIILDYLSR